VKVLVVRHVLRAEVLDLGVVETSGRSNDRAAGLRPRSVPDVDFFAVRASIVALASRFFERRAVA
jgi:hypothetical protein